MRRVNQKWDWAQWPALVALALLIFVVLPGLPCESGSLCFEWMKALPTILIAFGVAYIALPVDLGTGGGETNEGVGGEGGIRTRVRLLT